MKTRNSNSSKFMNNDDESLFDSESSEILNKRGLPKRKTTLKINYKLFDSDNSFDNALENDLQNNFDIHNSNNDFDHLSSKEEFSNYLYKKYVKQNNPNFSLFNDKEKNYFCKLDFKKQQELLDIKNNQKILCLPSIFQFERTVHNLDHPNVHYEEFCFFTELQ